MRCGGPGPRPGPHGAAPGAPLAPGPPVYIDIRPYRRHIGVRRGWCMHMPGIARDRPHNGRFWAVRSTASAVQGQRPLASRSKLNILFDHALGLFKILDHTEPNSHALPPHHCTAPARTPPCTTLALHHLDSFCTTLALHHTTPHSPAPHSPCTTRTTLACTTFALHHTLDLVLHHAIHHSRPAPHCTLACTTSALHHICLAPRVMSVYHTAHIYTLHSNYTHKINISRQRTMQHICLHHTAPHSHAPHLPCTTSALHHTRMHHTRLQLTRLHLTCLHHTRLHLIRPALTALTALTETTTRTGISRCRVIRRDKQTTTCKYTKRM